MEAVSEVRRLFALAWPVVLAQLGLMGMGVVDLLVVGQLGRDATAAVGIGNTLSFGTLILGFGAAHGLDPLVAQAFGANRPRLAGAEAARGLALVLLLGIPITVVHLLGDALLRMLGQPASVVPLAGDYLEVIAVGVMPGLAFQVVRQLLQGMGSMRPAMWVIALGNVVNLVADLALVPRYGVAGAAWATSLVRLVMLVALVALGWKQLALARPDGPVLAWREIARVARTALPVSVQIGLEVWAFNVGYVIAGWLGATEQAAHTAAMNAASISFMFPLGVSAAAATRVGNLVGARADWRRAAWTSVALGAGAMVPFAALFLLAPRFVAGLYNPDLAVVALTADVLPIAALFQLFDGTQVVAFGVLRGLGDTRRPALFNVLGYWVLGLPLGAWLALGAGGGLRGVWIGLSVALFVVAGLLIVRLRRHTGSDAWPASS